MCTSCEQAQTCAKELCSKREASLRVAGACGRGALDAARQKGVWGIGLDADMSYLGPHILTSAIKRYDAVVFDAILNRQPADLRAIVSRQ